MNKYVKQTRYLHPLEQSVSCGCFKTCLLDLRNMEHFSCVPTNIKCSLAVKTWFLWAPLKTWVLLTENKKRQSRFQWYWYVYWCPQQDLSRMVENGFWILVIISNYYQHCIAIFWFSDLHVACQSENSVFWLLNSVKIGRKPVCINEGKRMLSRMWKSGKLILILIDLRQDFNIVMHF